MNNISNILTSVIGKQLIGMSKYPPRTETKMEKEKILGDINQSCCVLKEGAECIIFRECDKTPEYTQIKIKLLGLGIKLFENEGENINGNRIFCEYDKIKLIKHHKRNQCVLKGQFVIGTVSKKLLPPGQFLSADDRIEPKTEWNRKIVSNE